MPELLEVGDELDGVIRLARGGWVTWRDAAPCEASNVIQAVTITNGFFDEEDRHTSMGIAALAALAALELARYLDLDHASHRHGQAAPRRRSSE